jgi:hypothetical protein
MEIEIKTPADIAMYSVQYAMDQFKEEFGVQPNVLEYNHRMVKTYNDGFLGFNHIQNVANLNGVKLKKTRKGTAYCWWLTDGKNKIYSPGA